MTKADTWRKLAAKALVAAHKTTDLEDKQSLTAIATAYEKLARRSEAERTRQSNFEQITKPEEEAPS